MQRPGHRWLGLALALLLTTAGCSRPPAPIVTSPGPIPTQPLPATPVPELPRSPSPSTSAAADPSPTASPADGSAQAAYAITDADNGRTFSYPVTTRFTLMLDERQHPRAELRVACTPDAVLGPISNTPAVPAPGYAVRYEGLRPGSCTITDREWVITIQIIG